MTVKAVVWWVGLVSVWMASLTTPSWPEFVAAGVTAGVCVPVAARARRVLDARPAVRPAWLRGLWRLPGAVPRETVTVWQAAARRLRAPVRGELRELPLGGDRSTARQAVAVLLLAATPGTVVVTVDGKRNTVLLHGFPGAEGPVERSVRS
jgi:multisubunit Na+/H+ antiporter MnhE subunit